MPFDFKALMEHPSFQLGLAALGSQNPGMLNAYQALQAQKKLRLEEEQRKMQQEQHQAEMEQTKIRNQLYGKQVESQSLNIELEKRKQEAILDFLKRRQGMGAPAAPQGGVAGPTMQPGAAAPPPMQPPEPVGKYGTPVKHLDNLMQIESGGRADAVGPLLPEGDRALGPFQFRKGTIDMLKKDGIVFNPFDIKQSRDAADFYIQKLVKEHGGDYAKAYAAYGGFKTKDPTAYVSRVMAGSPEKQVQQFAQNNALAEQSRKHKQLQEEAGAMRLLGGDMGGLKDLADAEKPDYELERLRLQQESDQRAIDADRRAEEANKRAAEAERRAAEKHQLDIEAASREKSDPKLTEAEAKATTYMRQMQDANAALNKLQKEGWNPEDMRNQAYTAMAGGALNALTPAQAQQAKQAQEQWAEAYLRFKTGAATNADEIARNVKTFFPYFGDKPANIEQKRQARADAERAMSIAAGKGAQKLDKLGPPGGQPAAPAGKTEVKRWKGAKSGKTVIQYSDGSTEYGD